MGAYLQPRLTRSNDATLIGTTLYSLLETKEGDIILGTEDDILKANTLETLAQRLLWFMRTKYDSVDTLPGFGSRLHQLYGQSSDDLELLESVRYDLLDDLVNQGFDISPEDILVLPETISSILIVIVILDNLPGSPTNGMKIEQTYKMSSEEESIEFLGAKSY